jgi:3-isopropylmalate/(R)-2-methylmalate dehydratase large subunit
MQKQIKIKKIFMQKTLFDKIWDAHVVKQVKDGPDVLYIDRHLIHEVTSPVAFLGLKKRKLKVFRPEKTTATPDHNVPTINQNLSIKDELSRHQVEMLKMNCIEHNIVYHALGTEGTELFILSGLKWDLLNRE